MSKNRLNMVLDFNNLAMRALFTCQFVESNVDITDFSTVEERAVLIRKIATDMSYIIRSFCPDRVIVACDSKHPWRNNLFDGLDTKYKGSREHDKNKDWDNIFEELDKFKDILRKKDFVVTEMKNTEADDIAAFWKEELVDKENENVILVSSDKDWTQLVSFDNISKRFCMCYNPVANQKKQKKLFVTEELNNWLKTPDNVDIFFNNYNEVKKKVNEAITKDEKIIVESIDPERVILDKIMCGDDGDDVPAFYDYYKNGKKTRITPLKASHVFEALNITSVDSLIVNTNANKLKEALEKEMKKEIDVDFPTRLIRQRKMVELKSYLFPENIVDTFNNHCVDVKNLGYAIDVKNIRMDDILRGSKYVDDDYHKKVKENSIFNDFRTVGIVPNPNKLF